MLKINTEALVQSGQSYKFLKKKENKQTDSIIYGYGKTKIDLRSNENRITFNYVGLQYQNSQLNQYAYKLDGYDKDWIQAGSQRAVTFTNLSPGTYTFHVKAANSDGVWSTKDEFITVIISPPWWETWWFYILSVIAMIMVVYAIVQKQSRHLKKQNIVLEEKVQHRTKELKNSLEELKQTQTHLIQSEKMASLGELTAGIAHEIQNPLNFVNNFSEVNTELIDELEEEINVRKDHSAIFKFKATTIASSLTGSVKRSYLNPTHQPGMGFDKLT